MAYRFRGRDEGKIRPQADHAHAIPPRGTLTSVVNTLVREGYVERRSDEGDRRVVRLFVTDKGRQVCEDYISLAGPHWRDAFGFVDPADEPVVRKFFVEMIGHFSELIRKERGK